MRGFSRCSCPEKRSETHPEHVRIFEVRLWVTLLGVDEVGKLGGVTDEEDRCVVEDPIEVTLLRPDLNSETCSPASTQGSRKTESGHTTGITGGVCRTGFSTDGGETDGHRRGLANLVEERGAAQVADVMGDLKDTMGTGALSMDDTLCTARSRPESHAISIRITCEDAANETHQEYARDRSGR